MKNSVITTIITLFCLLANSIFAQKTGVDAILESSQKEFRQAQQPVQQRQQAARQKEERQQETRDNLLGFLFDVFKIIVDDEEDEDVPAPKKQSVVPTQAATNVPDADDVLGVWENNGYLIFIDKYGRYSETTGNYGSILFSGTYDLSEDIFNVFDNNQTLVQSFKVRIKGSTLILTNTQTNLMSQLVYKCSTQTFYAKKDKEIANLTANTNRFVASQQGYITSGQIRNSVNYANTRRSYNEELIKAKAELKWSHQLGDADYTKKWEDKVYQIEQDIKRLDSNAGH